MNVDNSLGEIATRRAADPVAAVPHPLALSLGLVAVALAVFWPSVAALAELWSHAERRTYQHGYLIAAIALWLVYRERGRIAAAAGDPSPALLALGAAGGLAWAVAWSAGLQVAHVLLWPALLWAALGGALGRRAGRILLRPVAFLYFALPIWDALIPPLQAATVKANEALAALSGMPVIIEGTLVHIPEGSFEIAGGCSGLNYLIVGLAIAALLGEVNRDPPGRRLLLLALGGGMAILSNWLRVYIIIYAGHASDMTHYLVRVDHYNFGWVLYAFVLAGFFLLARQLPSLGPSPQPESPAAGKRAAWAGLAGGVLALAFGPGLAHVSRYLAERNPLTDVGGVSLYDSGIAGPWRALPASGEWVPVFPGADHESLADFENGDELITAYAATYLRQHQGRELISHDSRIEGSRTGRLVQRGRRIVAADPAIAVLEGEWQDSGGGRSLLWWSYQVGGRRFTNGVAAQLWYGVTSLVGAPVSSIVALRAACAGDCGRARAMLDRFAARALPRLLAASASAEE